MWEINQKSKKICRGKMVTGATGNDDLIPEWQVMETHLQVKKNLKCWVSLRPSMELPSQKHLHPTNTEFRRNVKRRRTITRQERIKSRRPLKISSSILQYQQKSHLSKHEEN